MSQNKKIARLINLIYCSSILLFILFLFSTNGTNVNYAGVIDKSHDITDSLIYKVLDKSENKLAYKFEISEKLIGNGAVKLSLNENKIKGVATGIGMTCQCNVDFLTKMEGTLDKSSGIVTVNVKGIGNPVGIFRISKIGFNGTIKGTIQEEKLALNGKVNIEGKLARFAGFKKTEDLLIEIPVSSLNIGLKEITKTSGLASL